MDYVTEFLTDYTHSLTYEKLPEETINQVKRHTIDAFGCALGGYNMTPPKVARAIAMEASGEPGVTVLGTKHRTSAELGAFANGVMVRYLDFNDTSISVDGGHSSDNIPAVLAAAEYAGVDAKTAIAGIVLGYEIQDRLADVCGATWRGWDHVIYLAISTAAGASKVMELNKEQTANALALAATFGIATMQTRTGELSMWKGCAAGNASRNGVFAAQLAKRGISGPFNAFAGAAGFLKQVGAGEVKLPAFGGDGRPFKVEMAKIKFFPSDYETQTAIIPMIELGKKLGGKVDDIEKVNVATYQLAVDIAADSRDKWNPTTRETADHSLPYVLSVGFTKGSMWLDDFTPERFRDPKILEMMQKIEIHPDKELDKLYPEANPFRIEVITRSGEKHLGEIDYGKGHPKNPMSDQEIEAKFRKLAEPIMKQSQMDKIIDRIWHFEEIRDLRELLALFELKS
jgi:2-methylcitrate dehydratase